MSGYRTEEEQLEMIKAWWRQHQQWILTLVCAGLVIVSGYRYWTWHETNVYAEASAVYESLVVAESAQDPSKIKAFSGRLLEAYGRTTYADFARLMLAKLAVTEGHLDEAISQLQQVVKHAKQPALRQVARLRLSRLLIEKNQLAEALAVLETVDNEQYQVLILEARGDIYHLQHHDTLAKQSYAAAKDLSQQIGMVNQLLEMKQLGG